MKYYNQRVLFKYSQYTICPHVSFLLDRDYTEEELREKVIDKALELQDSETISMRNIVPNYPGHEETRDTIFIYLEAKVSEDEPISYPDW